MKIPGETIAPRSDGAFLAELRAKTGAGLADCFQAHIKFGQDFLLCEGWLKYRGCAITLKPKVGQSAEERKEEWTLEIARKYKVLHTMKNNQPFTGRESP